MSGNYDNTTNLQEIQEAASDGPHWRPDIGEYEIIIDKKVVSYASGYDRAWEVYRELASAHWDHAKRQHGQV